MLIGAGEQHGVITLHPLEARDRLGGQGGVSVADVRRRGHIVKRCGDVVFHLEFFKYSKLPSAIISLSAVPVSIASRPHSSYPAPPPPSPHPLLHTLPSP